MEHRRGSHVRRLRDQTRYLESVEALGSYGRTSPSYKPAQSYAELSAVASIFRHFDDTFAIIDAVTARQTAVLHSSLSAAAYSTTDPAGRLMAISRAYLAYGKDNPATYRMLLGRRSLDAWAERDYLAPDTNPLIGATLNIATNAITDCVNAGISTSTNPTYDTLILWFALDGLINVTTAIASIDWPDQQQLLHDCVARATKLTIPPDPPNSPSGT